MALDNFLLHFYNTKDKKSKIEFSIMKIFSDRSSKSEKNILIFIKLSLFVFHKYIPGNISLELFLFHFYSNFGYFFDFQWPKKRLLTTNFKISYYEAESEIYQRTISMCQIRLIIIFNFDQSESRMKNFPKNFQ